MSGPISVSRPGNANPARPTRGAASADAFARSALFIAAHVMLTRSCQWTSIKAWGVRIAQRSSLKMAKIAVARKLAVIMHRMWHDETPFRCGAVAPATARCRAGWPSLSFPWRCPAGLQRFQAGTSPRPAASHGLDHQGCARPSGRRHGAVDASCLKAIGKGRSAK